MAEYDLRVNIVPNTRELDRELSKPRKTGFFSGIGGGGTKGAGGKDATGSLLSGISSKLGIIAIAVSALSGFMIGLKPIFDIIQAFGALLFFALSPIIIPAMKLLLVSLAGWTIIFTAIHNLLSGLVKAIGTGITWIWENLLKPIWDGLKAAILGGWEIFKNIGLWIWENMIKPSWAFLSDVGKWLWEEIIKPSWNFLIDVGKWIWEQIIKPGFAFWLDIGVKLWNFIKSLFIGYIDVVSMVWGFIKSLFRGTIDVAGSVWGFIKGLFSSSSKSTSKKVGDAIIRPNGQVIQTDPADTLIATKNPSSMFGGGGGGNYTITQNIYATVNSDIDIRMLAQKLREYTDDEVAKRSTYFRR